ncbi:hypothetical protein IRJ41_022545 [Triplophysa rosa]|uniref:Uncharacterized protein n=1 Tax=Triplophysa rosa TaxID=992332 RepID=A0A9W7X0P0_TRIRA|nr:hypothetical protein IRJ41_022545 [Triplophysa rosa]
MHLYFQILIVLCLITASLLALFYINNGLEKKDSSDIRSIGPLFNDNPSCACRNNNLLNQFVPENESQDLQKRRLEEYKQHQIRTGKQNDVLLIAPSNTPLQYPIRGFRVLPMNKTLIPGLAVQTPNRDVYQVSLRVGKGVLSVMDVQEGQDVDGQNEGNLTISSTSLEKLNDLLSRVTYTSTIYHIKTEDLGKRSSSIRNILSD